MKPYRGRIIFVYFGNLSYKALKQQPSLGFRALSFGAQALSFGVHGSGLAVDQDSPNCGE